MNVFLDTSVLVAAFLVDHPHYVASRRVLATCEHPSAACASHSLAEVYSTLTRLPPPNRASPASAIICLEEIERRFRLISLDGESYLHVIRDAGAMMITGGTIYDALIANCAIRSGADRIYTWNTRHFKQFGSDVADRLFTPDL